MIRKKVMLFGIFCFLLLGAIPVFAMTPVDVGIYYRGRNTKLEQPVYEENGNYFIPLRECAEQLGYTVTYEAPIISLKKEGEIEKRYDIQQNVRLREEEKPESRTIKTINGVTYLSILEFYNDLEGCSVVKSTIDGKTVFQIRHGQIFVEPRFQEETYQPRNFEYPLQVMEAMPKTENGVISPVSLKLGLSMVAEGTTGQTQAEILKALGYSSLEAMENDISNGILTWTVEERRNKKEQPESSGKIAFANGLWSQQNLFAETYANQMKAIFQGTVATVIPETALDTINQWGKQATEGSLPEMMTDANFDTALINTAYFRCSWEDAFLEENTAKGTFHNNNGTTSQVDFMHRTPDMDKLYCEFEGWQMLQLLYSDNRYGMLLFLPEEGTTEPLTNTLVNYLLQYADDTRVQITLPKFTTESEVDLKTTLQNMGIKGMFTNAQEFAPMYANGKGRCITDALQKTKIVVNEQGTEAGSGSILAARGADLTKPVEFTADRPFYYFIIEQETSEVIFAGQYVTGK